MGNGRPTRKEELRVLETHEALQEALGYSFARNELLIQALTHTSFANENGHGGQDNERLEFIGDAVLDLAIGHMLMARFTSEPEGVLSKLRAAVVNEAGLAQLAMEVGLGSYLRLGKGEDRTGGRTKASVLADAYEAVIGAVFLDGGFDAARDCVERHFETIVASLRPGDDRDFKTRLQELTQEHLRTKPAYAVLGEYGPDHDKTFEVALELEGEVRGVATGKSKKEAEQRAAQKVLEELQAELLPSQGKGGA